MDYATIIQALPKDVSTILHEKLDSTPMTAEMSPSEIKELINDAVKLTRLEIVIADDEKLRLVDTLLSVLADAGVRAIFPAV